MADIPPYLNGGYNPNDSPAQRAAEIAARNSLPSNGGTVPGDPILGGYVAAIPSVNRLPSNGGTTPGTTDNGGYVVGTPFIGLQGQAQTDGNNALNYINPVTDRRLNSILDKTGSPLRQGIIQQTDDSVTPSGANGASSQSYPYACRFMFNPPQLDIGYGVNNNVLPPGTLSTDQAAAGAFYPGSTSISFTLLFDRTYEVAYGPRGSFDADLRKIGVYADVAALEAVVGVRSARTTTFDSATGLVTPAARGTSAQIGNMTMVPVYLIFGGGKDTAGLAYVASIVSMSVTYALWSENMIPTRAGVQITAQQIVGPSPQDIYKKGGTLPDRLVGYDRVSTTSGGNYSRADAAATGLGTFAPLPGTVNR